MRKPFIAGNWKLNLLAKEAAALAREVAAAAQASEVEVGVAPVFTVMPAVAEALKGSKVRLAGQDLYWEETGAFTGEVSAVFLKDAGATHVIIGHSERRQFFHETDETVNRKLKAALKHGLVPILCIGETLAEREAEKTLSVLEAQVRGALSGIGEKELSPLVIAYEPVWAIGTGKTATADQAQEAHAFIRGLLEKIHSQKLAHSVRIQYGGSVKPGNAAELMAMPDIDGALVGGASLTAESFLGIINYKQ